MSNDEIVNRMSELWREDPELQNASAADMCFCGAAAYCQMIGGLVIAEELDGDADTVNVYIELLLDRILKALTLTITDIRSRN